MQFTHAPRLRGKKRVWPFFLIGLLELLLAEFRWRSPCEFAILLVVHPVYVRPFRFSVPVKAKRVPK